MPASTCEEITEVLDGLAGFADRLCALSFDVLDTVDGLAVMERIETVVRRLRFPGHALITHLADTATGMELGGTLAQALADRMRITKGEADRRIAVAADLGARRAMTGAPLAPVLEATAAAQRRGTLGEDHIDIIRKFFKKLPDSIDAPTREQLDHELALNAEGFRPDELAEFARVLTDCLKPDGDFVEDIADKERARKRGITLGRQQPDGMSAIRGLLSPEARTVLEPILAKLAAPGMANPDDPDPVVSGKAPADAVDRDTRDAAQRTHDALLAVLHDALASKTLGQHHGLPTTIVLTTTLAELEAGAGRALTAGGTLLPMADVIRLASHAHHYLAIFDKDKTLALYHGKRLANPEQRLVLLGKERGCTAPGCTVPGYWTQVHHVRSWLATRTTHIDDLTLACGIHNRMVEHRNYTTRKNAHGDTEWLPPPHLNYGRPTTNCMHHPERLLRAKEDDEPG